MAPAFKTLRTVSLFSCSGGSRIAHAIRDSPIQHFFIYSPSPLFVNEVLTEWTRDYEQRWMCDFVIDGCDKKTYSILLECSERSCLKVQDMCITFGTNVGTDEAELDSTQQSLRNGLCLCNPCGVSLRVEELLW